MKIPTDWTFKTPEVAAGFDRHVREQLPWYDLLTGAVAHIARHFIVESSTVYDLGCSTGNIGVVLSETIRARNARLVGVDESVEMQHRYKAPGVFSCQKLENFEPECFSVAVCFLVLMFLPREDRVKLLDRLIKAAAPGGAIIIVDKLEPRSGYLGVAISRLSIAAKLATGTAPEQIVAKELSLAGIQRPLAEKELIGEPIFRFGDFVGTVWVKD